MQIRSWRRSPDGRAGPQERQPAATKSLCRGSGSVSKQIVAALDAWRDMRDQSPNGSSFRFTGRRCCRRLSASIPLDAPLRKAGKSALHSELVQKRLAELKSRIKTGGLQEAAVRALIYVGLARDRVDERGVEAGAASACFEGEHVSPWRSSRRWRASNSTCCLSIRTKRSQPFRRRCCRKAEERRKAFAAIRQVLSASSEITGEAAARLARIAPLFGVAGNSSEKSSTCQGVVSISSNLKESTCPWRSSTSTHATKPHQKYERLLDAAKQVAAATTVVVHPCDETSLRGVVEAQEAGLIKPILVGPKKFDAVAKIRAEYCRFEIVDVPHSDAAAAKGVELSCVPKASF